MESDNTKIEDELDFVKIYNFIINGWKTIISSVLITGILGVGVSFILPEKFLASASIEPARVLGNYVESVNILSEKMRSPTYYSPATVMACGIDNAFDPTALLVKELKPEVRRQSAYVSISFKSKSVDTSKRCLQAVLDDTNRNQDLIIQTQIQKAQRDLKLAGQRLNALKVKQNQELTIDKEKLEVSKQKLNAAQDFITSYEKNNIRFDFKDEKFSASSLFLATVLAKQAEVKNLQIEINDLEMKVKASISSHDNEILNLENQIRSIEQSLLPPATEPAKFVVPIYASNQKIEPKRLLIVAISVLVGGILGLFLHYVRNRFYNSNPKNA